MNIYDLKWDPEDCVVDTARNIDLQGKVNREYRMYEIAQEELGGGSEKRKVTVFHPPTGLSVTESKFLPKRNKEIAMKKLKVLVEKWIAEKIEIYERANPKI